ncbi:MAG: hypothetical protein V7638_3781 [Acidobacteriota bacterium]|jgi:hypothetical protein
MPYNLPLLLLPLLGGFVFVAVESVISASLYLLDMHDKYFARKLIINETHVDRLLNLYVQNFAASHR